MIRLPRRAKAASKGPKQVKPRWARAFDAVMDGIVVVFIGMALLGGVIAGVYSIGSIARERSAKGATPTQSTPGWVPGGGHSFSCPTLWTGNGVVIGTDCKNDHIVPDPPDSGRGTDL